jgi:hypothetical protein
MARLTSAALLRGPGARLVLGLSMATTACAEELDANPGRRKEPTVTSTCDAEAAFGPILDQRCVSCHAGPVGSQGPYGAQQRASWRPDGEWRAVLDAIATRRMPPAGNAPLPDDVVARASGCLEAIPCAPSLPNRVTMVSRNYLEHALQQIFPAAVLAPSSPLFTALTNSDKTEPFRTITSGGEYSAVTVAVEIGWKIAFQGLGTDAAIDALDPCLAGYASADDATRSACVSGVLGRYASRILRREATDEDREAALTAYTKGAEGADHREGLRFAIAYLLARPEFLYHLEAAAGAAVLAQDEILSKLSRYLWDAPPDDALREWAAGKDLSTVAAREEIARRMLGDDRAKRQLRTFYTELLRLDQSVMLTTNPVLISGLDLTDLPRDARDEMLSFVEHVAFAKGGRIADLFISNEAVVPSKTVAAIYGAPEASVGVISVLPDRKGLLTRIGMLLASGDSPNVFHFGATIAKSVLCRDIPPPDPARIAEAAQVEVPADATTRERAELVTSSGTCLACHSQFNAYGYARTGYSTVGRRIATEKVFDPAGALVREAPVNTAGQIALDGKLVSIQNLDEASEAIGRSAEATRCFVSKYVSYSEGRRAAVGDQCFVDRMTREIAKDGLSLQEALVRMIASNEFVARSVQ